MLKDFFDGITSYEKAVRHVSRYNMWGYVILPGLLSLVLGAFIFVLAFSLSDNIGSFLDDIWHWEWGRSTVEKIARVFGGLLVVLLGLIIFKQLVMVVSAPFLSLLSGKVENQLLGKKESASFTLRQMTSDIVRGLRIALRNLARELILTLFLLAVGLIPVFTPFIAVAILLLQAYYAGFGNIDFALERHFCYRDSVRFVQRRRGLAIGNGLIYLALLFTFAGFLIALPLGTVAATIETVRRLEQAADAKSGLNS